MLRAFNQAILSLAPVYSVSDHAPELFPDLMQAGPLVIWAGASEGTIYDDARVNWAFRAWHDQCHKLGQFDFTLAGEIATHNMQARQLAEAFPRAPMLWFNVLRAEVIGQAHYSEEHGFFPADQNHFILEAINEAR